MGERIKRALRVNFDTKLKLEFHGANVTSNSDLLVYRELDDAFGLTDSAGKVCPEVGILAEYAGKKRIVRASGSPSARDREYYC